MGEYHIRAASGKAAVVEARLRVVAAAAPSAAFFADLDLDSDDAPSPPRRRDAGCASAFSDFS